MFNILTYGESILSEKAHEVTEFDHSLEQLIQGMHEVMRRNNGIGLAASQVGIPRRLFIVGIGDEPLRVFINPHIIARSQETTEFEEGCLSFPGLYFNVVRPLAVDIEAVDMHGKPLRISADGLLARVIQHEYDHLDGILFIDRVSPVKRKRALAHFGRMLKM